MTARDDSELWLDGLDVLLAEDNPTNQLVACQMLEALGASVTLSTDGIEALERLEERSFDVMLIDIEMPRLSGLDVIRRIREPESGHAERPAIALTAYVMPEHRAAITDAGADGIIAKPIMSIDEFGREIRRVMSTRRVATGSDATQSGSLDPSTEGLISQETLCALGEAVGRDALLEILLRAEEDLTEIAKTLHSSVTVDTHAKLREVTHILISVAGTIGAVGLTETAKSANTAAHQEEAAKISELLPELRQQTDAVTAEVRSIRLTL